MIDLILIIIITKYWPYYRIMVTTDFKNRISFFGIFIYASNMSLELR